MIKIENRPITNEIIIHSNFKDMSYFDTSNLYRLMKKEGRYSALNYIKEVISNHIENVIENEIRDNDVQILLCLGDEFHD